MSAGVCVVMVSSTGFYYPLNILTGMGAIAVLLCTRQASRPFNSRHRPSVAAAGIGLQSKYWEVLMTLDKISTDDQIVQQRIVLESGRRRGF